MSNKAKTRPGSNALKSIFRLYLHTMSAIFLVVIAVTVGGCSSQPSDSSAGSTSSKYDELLPATDLTSEEISGGVSQTTDVKGEAQTSRGSEPSLEDSLDQGVGETLEKRPELGVKPVVLLNHSFTIQLGYFESSAAASKFVTTHNLDAEVSGIAKVNEGGHTRHLLAYGIYSDKTQAGAVAEQMSQELGRSLKVVSLGEIEAIASVSEESPEITAY